MKNFYDLEIDPLIKKMAEEIETKCQKEKYPFICIFAIKNKDGCIGMSTYSSIDIPIPSSQLQTIKVHLDHLFSGD